MKNILSIISNIIVFMICTTNGARVLGIFPITCKSHFNSNDAIMRSLIEASHEVTVITPFPQQASEANYTSIIDVSNDQFMYVSQSSYEDVASLSVYELIDSTIEEEKLYCNKVMNLPEIRKILNSDIKEYDIIFIEILFLYKCYFPIAEKLKVPVIGTVTMRSWLIADNAISNPYHPGYIPYELDNSWQTNDFLGRSRNLWNLFLSKWCYNLKVKPFLRKFHADNAHYIGNQAKFLDMEPNLLFYNSHASVIPRPMNPNVIEVAGIQVKPAKPLSRHIEKFIEEAKHGVIVFSLGSLVRAAKLPLHIQNVFKEAFAEIPQRVIWKFEENLENLSDNVMLMEWLPQRDILEHKNVKAFISHCGQGGTYEAIKTTTPIIAIPLFADQATNAAILENHGVALRLSIQNITKHSLLKAINAIINDTRYQNNMRRLHTIFYDRPMTPQQNVVYWTEYVLRHEGALHLKTPAASLAWFQYLLLDVISLIVFFIMFTMYLSYLLVSRLYLQYFCYNKGSTIKNKIS